MQKIKLYENAILGCCIKCNFTLIAVINKKYVSKDNRKGDILFNDIKYLELTCPNCRTINIYNPIQDTEVVTLTDGILITNRKK